MKTYNQQELNNIFMTIAGEGLLVPMTFPQRSGPRPGPKFMVYRKLSEVVKPPDDVEQLYWDTLQNADQVNCIGEFCYVNANISEARPFAPQAHRDIAAPFVIPEFLPNIFDVQLDGGGIPVLFSRTGCLQTIRHLILYGRPGIVGSQGNPYFVGRLALLSNEFLQIEPVFPSTGPSTLDLLLLFAPAWDVYNSRTLGHAMSRMYILLTDILPGNDLVVVNKLAKLGMSADQIEVDGLPLNEFVSMVFGIFAFAGAVEGPARVTFRISEIFAPTGVSQSSFMKLIEARARTIAQFKDMLANGEQPTRETFAQELKRKAFLIGSLNSFRKYPLLRLDDDRVLILDVQFVVELLTLGVYWSIHDGLQGKKREDFKELWGRMYELYIVWLLRQFYPPASNLLFPDIQHSGGQIDALLDFGSFVVVMEIKSSLLTEPAKRSADKATFVADFRRKFVENEKGSPKAIKQLAAACRALLAGEIEELSYKKTAPVIYPVFISDEPIVETTFANAYFNEVFQQEAAIDDERVKSLTVISTDEIEQLLAHVPDNDFGWDDLLQARFNEFGVGPNSVGQTIYDILLSKGLRSKQNPALKPKSDELGEIIRRVFQTVTAAQPTNETPDEKPNDEDARSN